MHLSNARQKLGGLNCAWESKGNIPLETLTHGREKCVTHDTVTAAGYAEQCVVELTYPNVASHRTSGMT